MQSRPSFGVRTLKGQKEAVAKLDYYFHGGLIETLIRKIDTFLTLLSDREGSKGLIILNCQITQLPIVPMHKSGRGNCLAAQSGLIC